MPTAKKNALRTVVQNKCTFLDGKNKIYSTKNIYCGVMGKHQTYILGFYDLFENKFV